MAKIIKDESPTKRRISSRTLCKSLGAEKIKCKITCRDPISLLDLKHYSAERLRREDERADVQELFAKLKKSLPALIKLLKECDCDYEDRIYRFYHQSWKVYDLQPITLEIVRQLRALLPKRQLNKWFMDIVHDGTGKTWKKEDNEKWAQATRPIVEAFFHSHYFLTMAVKYAKELVYPPKLMPSGWAAFLYLYDLR